MGVSLIYPKFGAGPRFDVSRPARQTHNKYVELRESQPPGFESSWLYLKPKNSNGVVRTLLVVENEQGQRFVHLMITDRPPMEGTYCIELPGGIWGDKNPDESPLEAARREVLEETGYSVSREQLLSDDLAASSGMSSERTVLTLAFAKGKPGKKQLDSDERTMLVDEWQVPMEIFLDPQRFNAWVKTRQKPGQPYRLGMDVVAARGMLPRATGSRLSQEG